MAHRRLATGWQDWRLGLGFRLSHGYLGCYRHWCNIMVLRIGIRGRRGHVWLLRLLFHRLGGVVGLRGSCRGVCVPIWSDLIIAWFCGLVCRGGGRGGGGGTSLTRALEIRYHYPEGVERVLTSYNADRVSINESHCMRLCSLTVRSRVMVGCGAGAGSVGRDGVTRVVSDSE